jgi:hypothetical protein
MSAFEKVLTDDNSFVEVLETECFNLRTEIIRLNERIRELESQLYGGSTK